MKKIKFLSLIGLMLIGSFSIQAQEETNYFAKKNEINIQVDNIFASSDFINYIYLLEYNELGGLYNFYYKTPSVGIGYKYHYAKGALRIKFSMSTLANKSSQEENDYDDYQYALHQEQFSAGYEFHNNIGRSQIFFGIDGTLGFQASKSISNTSYKDTIERTNKSSAISFGVKPFLGFKVFISQNFSVSSEYHFLAEFYSGKSTYNVDETNERVVENSGYSSQFGPLGQLTFSFHF